MSELVLHDVDGKAVQQRASDGYINATQLCQAAGKLFADYKRLDTAKEFWERLSSKMGIPILELVYSNHGNAGGIRGTWVHPKIAIHLAHWLSADFALMVAEWVEQLMTKGVVTINQSDDPIVQSCLQIAEVRMKQVALEKEQAETRRLTEAALQTAEGAEELAAKALERRNRTYEERVQAVQTVVGTIVTREDGKREVFRTPF